MAFYRTDDGAGWMHINFGRKRGSAPCRAPRLEGDDPKLDTAYKDAARTHHPDRGGTDEGMAHVNRARDYALMELQP